MYFQDGDTFDITIGSNQEDRVLKFDSLITKRLQSLVKEILLRRSKLSQKLHINISLCYDKILEPFVNEYDEVRANLIIDYSMCSEKVCPNILNPDTQLSDLALA